MAKDITLKTRNGETRYPKSVTDLIFENGTGKTLQTIITELRQVDSDTDTRTRMFKADVTNLDTLNKKTDIGLYNYTGNGWRGAVSINYDSADNVSQVALSSSTPSYNGNTLTWLSAQPCAMARTYKNGAWSHWEKVGAPVVNDLTTGGTDKALSAEMGKELKEGLDALGPKISKASSLTFTESEKFNKIIRKLYIDTSGYTGNRSLESLRIAWIMRGSGSTPSWGIYIQNATQGLASVSVTSEQPIIKKTQDGIFYYIEFNWENAEAGTNNSAESGVVAYITNEAYNPIHDPRREFVNTTNIANGAVTATKLEPSIQTQLQTLNGVRQAFNPTVFTTSETINKIIKKIYIDTSGYTGSLALEGLFIHWVMRGSGSTPAWGVYIRTATEGLVSLSVSSEQPIISTKSAGIYYYIEFDWANAQAGSNTSSETGVTAYLTSAAFNPIYDPRRAFVNTSNIEDKAVSLAKLDQSTQDLLASIQASFRQRSTSINLGYKLSLLSNEGLTSDGGTNFIYNAAATETSPLVEISSVYDNPLGLPFTRTYTIPDILREGVYYARPYRRQYLFALKGKKSFTIGYWICTENTTYHKIGVHDGVTALEFNPANGDNGGIREHNDFTSNVTAKNYTFNNQRWTFVRMQFSWNDNFAYTNVIPSFDLAFEGGESKVNYVYVTAGWSLFEGIVELDPFTYYQGSQSIHTKVFELERLTNEHSKKLEITNTPKISNPRIDIRNSQELKVLDIGNSYTIDSVSYIPEFIAAANVDVSDMCLYTTTKSGATFKDFYDDFVGGTSNYGWQRIFGGITQPISGNSTAERFKSCKWDVIIIHQAGSLSANYNDFEGNGNGGYLREFIRILRTYQPQAMIGLLAQHSAYNSSPNGDTATRLGAMNLAVKWIMDNYGINFVIPYGAAIENLRASSLNVNSVTYGFSRDAMHLGFGLARYVAAATYYHTLVGGRYGVSVLGNTAVHPVTDAEKNDASYIYPDESVDVTSENRELAQKCAVLACSDMFTVNNPDGVII